jgi:hypothetical protein
LTTPPPRDETPLAMGRARAGSAARTALAGVAILAALALSGTPGLEAAAVPSPSASQSSPASTVTGPKIAAVGDLVCAFGKHTPRKASVAKVHGKCEPGRVASLVKKGNYRYFIPLGDLQYSYGGYWRYLKYWDHYYGSVKNITRPVAGNHEAYNNFAGYVRYFGTKRTHFPSAYANYRIGEPAQRVTGYYSYNIGSWHVIALNGQLCFNKMWDVVDGWTNPIPGGGCGKNSPQYEWLKRDLAQHPNSQYPCTLALTHQPMFKVATYKTSGTPPAKPLWQLLVNAGVDVILAGHQHDYQHWVPMDANGNADPNGMAEFIVGTGGDTYQPIPDKSTWPSTVATANTGTYGILSMTLGKGAYSWKFIPAWGQPTQFTDSGSQTCS